MNRIKLIVLTFSMLAALCAKAQNEEGRTIKLDVIGAISLQQEKQLVEYAIDLDPNAKVSIDRVGQQMKVFIKPAIPANNIVSTLAQFGVTVQPVNTHHEYDAEK